MNRQACSHLRSRIFPGPRGFAMSGRMAKMPKVPRGMPGTLSPQGQIMASFWPTSVDSGLLEFCLWAVFSLPMQMSLVPLCPSLQPGPPPHLQSRATTMPGQASLSAQSAWSFPYVKVCLSPHHIPGSQELYSQLPEHWDIDQPQETWLDSVHVFYFICKTSTVSFSSAE